MAACPFRFSRLMISALKAVSSASTTLIRGCWFRNSRHCIRAIGWEFTSVMSFQSSSGRQTKLCEMRNLYSPIICVPLWRNNSLLCSRLPAIVFSMASIPMVWLSFRMAANTSSKLAQQINSISSPSKYLCAAISWYEPSVPWIAILFIPIEYMV